MPRGRDEIRPMDENPSMEQLLGVPTIDGVQGEPERAIMALFAQWDINGKGDVAMGCKTTSSSMGKRLKLKLKYCRHWDEPYGGRSEASQPPQ